MSLAIMLGLILAVWLVSGFVNDLLDVWHLGRLMPAWFFWALIIGGLTWLIGR